jgi:hypothetical protein
VLHSGVVNGAGEISRGLRSARNTVRCSEMRLPSSTRLWGCLASLSRSSGAVLNGGLAYCHRRAMAYSSAADRASQCVTESGSARAEKRACAQAPLIKDKCTRFDLY